MPTEIDLEKPQALLASATNAGQYLFFLIKPDPKYTAESIGANPNSIAAADIYFKSPMVTDNNGKAAVDLEPKAIEMKKMLTDESTPVKGVLWATEKTGKGLPKAILTDFVLKKSVNTIKLTAIRAFAEPTQWATYHHCVCFIEMQVSGAITKVIIDTQPKPYDTAPGVTGVWKSAGPGQIDPSAGFVIGSLGENHSPNGACGYPASMHGDMTLWSTCFGDNHHTAVDLKRTAGPKPDTYVIGLYPRATGTCVLTVTGTGDYEKTVVSLPMQFGFNGAHPHPGD